MVLTVLVVAQPQEVQAAFLVAIIAPEAAGSGGAGGGLGSNGVSGATPTAGLQNGTGGNRGTVVTMSLVFLLLTVVLE